MGVLIRHKHRKMLLLAIVFGIVLPLFAAHPVRAESLPIQVDYTATNQAVIKSAWYTEHDYLYVFQEAPFNPTKNWRDSLNYDAAYWIFDARGNPTPKLDGFANLIIKFHREGRSLIADLYDDQNGDGLVSYNINNGKISLTERQNWTVRFVGASGWWEREGKPNFDLDIFVDGNLTVMTQGQLQGVGQPQGIAPTTDGSPDYIVQIRPDATGRADLDLRRSFQAGVIQTTVVKNQGSKDVTLDGSLFWAYLALSSENTYNRGWNSFAAPLRMDWKNSKLTGISEFIASQAANNRTISSAIGLSGQVAPTLSETYDLANAKDDAPDLQILARTASPLTNVQYTWDKNHDHIWDFRFGLVGTVTPDSKPEAYLNFALNVPKRDQLPAWVTLQKWSTLSFLENVSNSKPDFSGWNENYPYSFGLLPEGMRGEFELKAKAAPELYFSPLDHRLHLKRATHSLWSVKAGEWLEGYSSDGQYINQWIYFKNGRAVQSLVYSGGWLVLSDDNRLQLKALPNLKLAELELLPPNSPATWREFNRLSRQYSATATDTPDLAAWFGQYDVPTQTVMADKPIEFYQRAGQVYFKLSLSNLPPDIFEVKVAQAGEYVLTPALPKPLLEPYRALKVSVNGFTLQNEATYELAAVTPPDHLEALRPLLFGVRVQAEGTPLTDNYTLELLAANTTEPQVIARQAVSLKEMQNGNWFSFRWTPPDAGSYSFRVRVTPQYDPMPTGYFSTATVGQNLAAGLLSLKTPLSGNLTPLLVSPIVKTLKVLPPSGSVLQFQQASDWQLLLLGAVAVLLALAVVTFALTKTLFPIRGNGE